MKLDWKPFGGSKLLSRAEGKAGTFIVKEGVPNVLSGKAYLFAEGVEVCPVNDDRAVKSEVTNVPRLLAQKWEDEHQ